MQSISSTECEIVLSRVKRDPFTHFHTFLDVHSWAELYNDKLEQTDV